MVITITSIYLFIYQSSTKQGFLVSVINPREDTI